MKTLITALATPYKNEKIDTLSYEKLVKYQLDNGVDALLAVGTTAEAQSLKTSEKTKLIQITKSMAKKTPVWVGVGGSLAETIHSAVLAEKLGANGLLVAPPAFVKCTPEGYLMYVKNILSSVSIPLMLYNAPNRAGYVLDKDTVAELSGRVRYLKDAGKDLKYTAALAPKLKVLCGNDLLLPQMLNSGACGVVSVVSNVAPALTRRILNGPANDDACDVASGKERIGKSSATTRKNKEPATTDDYKLFATLAKLSMLEVSPVAIKYMLYKKGIFAGYNMRLPLTRASEQTQKTINRILGY